MASYFSDPDGDTLRYAATTSNAGVVSVDVSGSTLTLTAIALGTATVTVTATDPDGLSATQSLDVSVETPNRAPARVGSIPAQAVTPGGARRLDVARYFRDPDGDALGYEATSSNAGVLSVSMSRQRVDHDRGGGGYGDRDGDGGGPGRSERDAERGRDGDVQPRTGAGRARFRPSTSTRGGR